MKVGIFFIIFFSLLIYIATLRGTYDVPITKTTIKTLAKSPGPFESSHERAPYALIVSLVQNKSFALSDLLVSFGSPDTILHKGQYFIIFPPGISFVGIPFYLIGGLFSAAQLVTYLGMSVFAMLSMIFIYLISKNILRLSLSLSFLAAFIYGFASTSLSFAASLYQHHAVTFLILSAFYAAWRYKQSASKFLWGSWVWASTGFMIWLDYPSAVLMMPVIFYLLLSSLTVTKKHQKYVFKLTTMFLLSSVIFFVIVGLHGLYNHRVFGSWKAIAQLLPRYDDSVAQKLQSTGSEAKKAQTVVDAEKDKSIKGIVREDLIVRGFETLSVAPDKGLFFFSPIFLVAIAGIFASFKKMSLEKGSLIAIALVNIWFYSSWSDPWGGWAYGPRYLVPSMAVLSLFVTSFLGATRYKLVANVVAFILIFYSSAIALLGALTTSAVPPKIEADYLKIKYGYFNALDFFYQGKSSSFVFNEFIARYISLQQYFVLLFAVLVLTAYLLLFILPYFERKHELKYRH